MKVILIDKDGTLLDYEKVWGPYARKCVDNFVHTFDKHHEKESLEKSLGVVDGEIQPNSVVASGTGSEIQNTFERYAESGKAWAQRHYEENFDFIYEHMKLIDGAKETLEAFDKMGYKNVIVTSDSRKSTEAFIEKFSLESLVFDVVAGGDSEFCKPDIRVLDDLIERYNLNISDLIMVGDNSADTMLGFEEGLFTVGVLSGTSGAADLEGADIILDSIEDMIQNDRLKLDNR